jgi:hypothetical protein
MNLTKTQKRLSLALSVLAIPAAVVTFWTTCDLPAPATNQDIEHITEEQATIAIDVYSQQERDLRREELDLHERVQMQEARELPPTAEDQEYNALLKRTLEDTKEEKEEVQKKRTYYEEKALDLKKGK